MKTYINLYLDMDEDRHFLQGNIKDPRSIRTQFLYENRLISNNLCSFC